MTYAILAFILTAIALITYVFSAILIGEWKLCIMIAAANTFLWGILLYGGFFVFKILT